MLEAEEERDSEILAIISEKESLLSEMTNELEALEEILDLES